MKSEEEIIKEMQLVTEQMRIDDIEDNPETETEIFECDCCGKGKPLAGSVEYSGYRLCNDCVLLAETGFALGKFNDITKLIDAMEDTRLEGLCEIIRAEEKKKNN